MPLRSPKMYSFIFGFQRLVWWPKCTPASSSSFIAIPVKLPPECASTATASRLTLAELEALARPRHAVLLALLGARVARQEAAPLERACAARRRTRRARGRCRGAWRRPVRPRRRRSRSPARRTAPSSRSRTSGCWICVRSASVGKNWLEGAVVDRDGAGAGPEIHARGGCLATACAVELSQCHVTRPRSTRVSERRAGARRPRTP